MRNSGPTAQYLRLQHAEDDDRALDADETELFVNSTGVEVEDSFLGKDNLFEKKALNNRKHRPVGQLCRLNAFGFAYGLLIATYGVITLPTEAERMYPEKHALLLALFMAIAGVSQLSGPVAGFFSDRCTHTWGRRRPFLAYGGLVGFVCLLVQWWAHTHLAVYTYLTAFLVSMLALNVMYTAYSGALTDLVPDEQLGQANGIMGVFAVLGASSGFGAFSQFLTIETGYLFYALVLLVTVAISVYSMDEVALGGEAEPWTYNDLWLCYYISPTRHRDFFLVFASRTQYYMGVSVQTFMLFYFRDLVVGVDSPKAGVALLALCGQLAGAIVCYPMGLLSDRLGRKPLIYISSGVIVFVYLCFMVTRSMWAVLAAGVVYGVGNGAYLSVDYALACDTLPSKDQAARYLGIWGVAAFLGTMMGPLIVGPLLMFFGDLGAVDAEGMPRYDAAGYIAILAVGCLCMVGNAVTVAPVRAR